MSNSNNDEQSPLLSVLLDVFHGMQRISRTIKLKHGAARAFLARLRDAFFVVSKKDIDALCAFLQKQGLSDGILRKEEED